MRKPSAAITISTAALFFSLTGAGIAAQHYLITSTKQIKPSVLRQIARQLPAARGPRGGEGEQGVPGPAGTIDWQNEYTVTGDQSNGGGIGVLTLAQPDASVVEHCRNPDDHVLYASYTGWNEIVTTSEQIGSSSWFVAAHLDPNATLPPVGTSPGEVALWLTCVSASS